MTYLAHNKTLFELYTACSALAHFVQFSSTSAAAPVSAVTVAEGGRHPKATLSDRQCKEMYNRALLDPELTASTLKNQPNQPRRAKLKQ